MIRYAHTNIIANDWKRLSLFYQRVFGCTPISPRRDLKGDWVDRLTGIPGARIMGEHLALPGYGAEGPTLEIFSYDNIAGGDPKAVNRVGLSHLAFEVGDVAAVLRSIEQEGGGRVGEPVRAEYPGNVTATFVYARDIEGNIIELQGWEKQ